MFAPTMHVCGEIARGFSVIPTVIRTGPKASLMVRGLQLGHVPDVEPSSISQRWIAHRRWKPGSARRKSAISRKSIHPLLRDNWTRCRWAFRSYWNIVRHLRHQASAIRCHIAEPGNYPGYMKSPPRHRIHCPLHNGYRCACEITRTCKAVPACRAQVVESQLSPTGR